MTSAVALQLSAFYRVEEKESYLHWPDLYSTQCTYSISQHRLLVSKVFPFIFTIAKS